MRIALPAQNSNGVESVLAAHFGHAPFFVFVDIEGEKISAFESVANPFGRGHAPGQLPRFIKERGANVILTGGMGTRALESLANLGIQAATGASGTVRSAIGTYLGGNLTRGDACNKSLEHGHGG